MSALSKSAFVIATALLAFGGSAHAQQPPTAPLPPNTYATAGAAAQPQSVSLRAISVTSQQGHTLHISFDIRDASGTVPSLRYAVIAEVASTTGTYVVDQYVFPDSVILHGHTPVHTNIVYEAPIDLVGSYSLYIQAADSAGSTLARAPIGTVVFATSTAGIAVSEPCSLYVKDASGASLKSMLFNGALVKKDQTLTLECLIKNYADATTSFTPQFETRAPTPYGDTVVHSGVETPTQSLGPHALQQLLFALPTVSTPGIYSIAFSLTTGKGDSNTKYIHYVRQGADASIQNVTLDKNYYARGDAAQVGFVWTAAVLKSSTSTTILTQTAEITLQDGAGSACADTVKQDATSGSLVTVVVPVAHDCTDPQVTVRTLDSGGSVLTGAFATMTPMTAQIIPLRMMVIAGLCVVVLLGVLLVVIVWIRRRARKRIVADHPTVASSVSPLDPPLSQPSSDASIT